MGPSEGALHSETTGNPSYPAQAEQPEPISDEKPQATRQTPAPEDPSPEIHVSQKRLDVDPYDDSWKGHPPPLDSFEETVIVPFSELSARDGYWMLYDISGLQPGKTYVLDTFWYYREHYDGLISCYSDEPPPVDNWQTIDYRSYASPAYLIQADQPRCSLLLNARLPYHWAGPGQILTESSYYRTLQIRSAFYAAIFSAIALLILYQTALAIYTRSRFYLFYLLSAVSYFAYQIGFTGYAVQLNLVSPIQNHYLMIGFLSWEGFFLLFLGELFQGIRKNAWILRMTRLLGVLCVGGAFAQVAMHPTSGFSITENGSYLLLLVMTGMVLFGLSRRGIVGFVVFLAFTGVVAGVVVIALTNPGIIPLNLLTRHAPLIGSTVEMTVLAVLMGVMLRNVQSSRLRSNAEEKLGKDVEQKANHYARQLQTEILDRAALDLRLPVESIYSAIESAATNTGELDATSGDILSRMKKEAIRLDEGLRMATGPRPIAQEHFLCIAMEALARQRLIAAWDNGSLQVFHNHIPFYTKERLRPAEQKRLAERIDLWNRAEVGALEFHVAQQADRSQPELVVTFKSLSIPGEDIHPERENNPGDETLRETLHLPLAQPFPQEAAADIRHDDFHEIGALTSSGLRCWEKPSSLMEAFLEGNLSKPMAPSGNTEQKGPFNTAPNNEGPVAEGQRWQTLESPPAPPAQCSMYLLDLSELRFEDTESIHRLKTWMDQLAEEQPTLILLGDRRIRPEDLELEPDLDTVLYRPVNPELLRDEWMRTVNLAERLRSERESYDITRQRSEARLRRTLEKALGTQLRELQRMAAGPESGMRRKEIAEKIQSASQSLRKILQSLPE